LYSPYGFYRWSEAVSLYIRALKNHDNTLLKTFVNTVLGETWSETGRIIKASALLKRKIEYGAEVPEGAVLLTGAADIQKDRIETEIIGWGRGMESWGIDYAVFRGDTERADVWLQLDQYLNRGWRAKTGNIFPVSIVAIDSGYLTKLVYEFCRQRIHRMIFPVKGDEGWGHGYIDRPLKMNKYGVWPFRAFVDEIKNKVYSYLQIEDSGPGACHWPNKDCYDKAYFSQLTSEYLDKKYVNGRYRLKWMLPQGRRNEALDIRCLNIAALNILNPQFDTLQMPIQNRVVGRGRNKRRRVMSKGLS
jgi:phage terminase large subunit GpA-like protein